MSNVSVIPTPAARAWEAEEVQQAIRTRLIAALASRPFDIGDKSDPTRQIVRAANHFICVTRHEHIDFFSPKGDYLSDLFVQIQIIDTITEDVRKVARDRTASEIYGMFLDLLKQVKISLCQGC